MVLKLKQLIIFCFIVPATYMKENFFWTTSNLSFLIFWNKVTLLLIMFFSLAIPWSSMVIPLFIMELYNLHKFGKKSTKSCLQSKTQTLHIWDNNSKLTLKNYIGVLQHGCHILWGFRCNFYQSLTRFTREAKKIKVQIFQEFVFLIKVNICR